MYKNEGERKANICWALRIGKALQGTISFHPQNSYVIGSLVVSITHYGTEVHRLGQGHMAKWKNSDFFTVPKDFEPKRLFS